MSEPSDHSGSPEPREGDEGEDGSEQSHPRKRQRVRLSCLECRRRKLSCDRGFPCERCIRSGTPDRCSYETRPGLAPPNKLGLTPAALSGGLGGVPGFNGAGISSWRKDVGRETDRIRRLELEVAQLKGLLAKTIDGSTIAGSSPNQTADSKDGGDPEPLPPDFSYQDSITDKDEIHFYRGKEWKSRFHGPHTATVAFSELTGLCPFMKETSAEWLKPFHVERKDKKAKFEREKRFIEPDVALEALLPSKEETDALVNVYLEQFEQVHRIVHIPTFRREYAEFWGPTPNRPAAFTAVVLAMMSISACLHEHKSTKMIGMMTQSHHSAVEWIRACDAWQEKQSQKHRKLVHFQLACLVYLAKRVNVVKKKRFWKGAGQLVQEGISVGLHRDLRNSREPVSPYSQEMRRRLWATMQSFDLHAAFDYGLPTLLISLYSDITEPGNLNDEDFDEETKVLPPSKPASEYTDASYQHLSRRSLALRLELCRFLTGPPDEIDYEQVIRYTNEITHEIDSLPSWDTIDEDDTHHKPLLAYTFLHIQLRQYILPLHQPYLRLRKANSKYMYSEIVYYNAARDMILLVDKLHQQGIRTLNFLREDCQTLPISLCSVTMLQPRGSTNMIMINSQNTLQLIEKCLEMKEDRILRCGNYEPWNYSIMCAAFGLLQAHLGFRTAESAKASAAERFISLHYRLVAGQLESHPSSQGQMPPPPPSSQNGDKASQNGDRVIPPDFLGRARSVTPFFPPSQRSATPVTVAGSVEVPGTPWWLPTADPSLQPANLDLNLEQMGVNLNELWGDNWDWAPQT